MLTSRKLLSMAEKVGYIQKMISLSSITLSPEEADRFIQLLWDQSVMKNHARKVNMSTSTKNIRGIGIASGRVLVPEAYFDESKVKKTFDHNRIQLSTKELRAGVLIKDSDLEDINVGTAAEFKNTLIELVTKKIANEIDEICWIADNEDLSGFAADDARSTMNGWRYQLDNSQSGEDYENDVTGSCVILDASNTVTAKAASYDLTTTQAIAETDSDAPYSTEYKFGKMVQYLPSEYKTAGLDKLRFFVNDQVAQNYLDKLMARSTALGDSILTGQIPLRYGIIPIVTCPLMPTCMEINASDAQKENYDATNGDLTDALLTMESNLVFGIQTEIQYESERSAADRGTYFYYTIRMDVGVEDVRACVLLKRLKVV